MAEVQELMKRLEAARTKADEMEREKSRLTGELEATKKRLGELETKCSEEFDCEITALPGFIKQLEEEAEKVMMSRQSLMGLPDKTVRTILMTKTVMTMFRMRKKTRMLCCETEASVRVKYRDIRAMSSEVSCHL